MGQARAGTHKARSYLRTIISLIAILLGRLRLSAADAIRVYEELVGKVFLGKKIKGQRWDI